MSSICEVFNGYFNWHNANFKRQQVLTHNQHHSIYNALVPCRDKITKTSLYIFDTDISLKSINNLIEIET